MIDSAVLQEFAQAYHSLPYPQRGDAVRAFAANAGEHVGTIYRRLRKLGYGSGRKRRNDAGVKRRDDAPEELMRLAKLRAETGWLMPMWRVLEIGEEKGLVPKGKYREWHVHRFLRERGVSRRDIKGLQSGRHASRDIVAERVNQVQGFDPSGCRQWRLFQDDDGSVGKQDRRTEVYGYKTGNGKTAILRYVLEEKLSGAFYFRYYPGPGESAENMLDFLHRAWDRKADPVKYPFCGTPEELWGDMGSAGNSAVVQNLLRQFDIKWVPHAVGSPRAKGCVESPQWYIEQAFESELGIWPARSVDELNDRADAFCAKLNATRKHSRHGMVRSEAFCKIGPDQLRLPPPWQDYMQLCHTRPVTRVVKSGGKFSFKGIPYRVPTNEYYAGDTIFVSVCPFDKESVYAIHRGKTYQCKPIPTDDFGQARDENAVLVGNYKGIKYNRTQKMLRDLKDVELDSDALKQDHWADIQAEFPLLTPSEYEPPKPEEIIVPRLAAIRRVAEAVERMAKRKLTDDEYDYLQGAFVANVPETTIRATIAFLTKTSVDAVARIA